MGRLHEAYRLFSVEVRTIPFKYPGWGLTLITTYRSPGWPPRHPISPSPGILSLEPVSTPGGIFTCVNWSSSIPCRCSYCRVFQRPSPLTLTVRAGAYVHHLTQYCGSLTCLTCPLPPHVEQVPVPVPGSARVPLHT